MTWDVTGISPEQASHGATDLLPDVALPMLAAVWLADGWDSPALRRVAGLTAAESLDARRAWPEVLASLGYPDSAPRSPWDESPWRGYWTVIDWARRVMDDLLSPCAAAQRVLEIAGDVPELWEPAGGTDLMALLRRWDQRPDERVVIDGEIRQRLRRLREEDVPPLVPPPAA